MRNECFARGNFQVRRKLILWGRCWRYLYQPSQGNLVAPSSTHNSLPREPCHLTVDFDGAPVFGRSQPCQFVSHGGMPLRIQRQWVGGGGGHVTQPSDAHPAALTNPECSGHVLWRQGSEPGAQGGSITDNSEQLSSVWQRCSLLNTRYDCPSLRGPAAAVAVGAFVLPFLS